MRDENIRRRVLKPIGEEVGAPWMGFHTLRHSFASLSFAAGANAKQVQRLLGHHSAAFTLDTYIHLVSDEVASPLDLTVLLSDQLNATVETLAA